MIEYVMLNKTGYPIYKETFIGEINHVAFNQ